MNATAPITWKGINGISFSFAEHRKSEFRLAHRTLNHCFERGFGRTEIPHLFASLHRQHTLIDQIRQIFLNGLIVITGGDVDLATGFPSVFAPLDMTYTKGTSNRYVLDTAQSLASLLDYTAANGPYGSVKIELDITPLYFNDNYDAFNSHFISFTSFKKPVMIFSQETDAQRHANALRVATTGAVTRQSNARALYLAK